MSENFSFVIYQKGKFNPPRRELNCVESPNAPLLNFFSWSNHEKVTRLLPRIITGNGGNGISDHCSYHFSTESEIGVYVRPGYVLLSDFVESSEIPLLLFYGFIDLFFRESNGQFAEKIQECVQSFQHQGRLETTSKNLEVVIQFQPNEGWSIPPTKRHLLEELDISARALLGVEKMYAIPGISAFPRIRFIEAMKAHSFWGQPIPPHIAIACKDQRFSNLKELCSSYEFLLDVARYQHPEIEISSALELLPLSIDFQARTNPFRTDGLELKLLAKHCIEYWQGNKNLASGQQTVQMHGRNISISIEEISQGRLGIVRAIPEMIDSDDV
jgi:hypothetical protein